MDRSISQSAFDCNRAKWYYVVVRFFDRPTIREHHHGLHSVTSLIARLSTVGNIRSVSFEEHNP